MKFLGEDFQLERHLKRARLGDRDAWDRLVVHYQALVYSIPRRMGLGDEDAADVFQQTFIALYRNLDRIQEAKTLPKWLAITASREALRVKRLRSRTEASDHLDDVLATEDAESERLALEADLAHQVRVGLKELGGRCQELLTWLYLEELTYQEIEARGTPIGAIGPTRGRCLEKLRKILQTRGVSEETLGDS